jgi:hypothetical protein
VLASARHHQTTLKHSRLISIASFISSNTLASRINALVIPLSVFPKALLKTCAWQLEHELGDQGTYSRSSRHSDNKEGTDDILHVLIYVEIHLLKLSNIHSHLSPCVVLEYALPLLCPRCRRGSGRRRTSSRARRRTQWLVEFHSKLEPSLES